tara:strand:- start:98 stop:451 length:354 start_codon:yes stop_codon:yes gene_type:complete
MNDKILNNIKTLLLDLDSKVSHIEDMEADNRAIIVKLVKQNNQIVEFLKNLEIDIYEDDNLISSKELSIDILDNSEKIKEVKKLFNMYREKSEDLMELEEELKKIKDQITPGQIGEA